MRPFVPVVGSLSSRRQGELPQVTGETVAGADQDLLVHAVHSLPIYGVALALRFVDYHGFQSNQEPGGWQDYKQRALILEKAEKNATMGDIAQALYA